MVHVIVAAHGRMADSMVGSAEMILGKIDGVGAVTFEPGQGPDDLLAEYERLSHGGEPTVLLVDLMGGSPYNAAVRWAVAHPGTDVVTGLNLPMLIEVASQARRGKPLKTLVKAAQAAGGFGIRAFLENYVPPTAADDDEGDELL